jgi:hypothetical protein
MNLLYISRPPTIEIDSSRGSFRSGQIGVGAGTNEAGVEMMSSERLEH